MSPKGTSQAAVPSGTLKGLIKDSRCQDLATKAAASDYGVGKATAQQCDVKGLWLADPCRQTEQMAFGSWHGQSQSQVAKPGGDKHMDAEAPSTPAAKLQRAMEVV